MKKTDILYSINVQDVQDVAQREFDRKLNDKEMESVTAKLGEYVDRYEAVNSAVAETIQNGKRNCK